MFIYIKTFFLNALVATDAVSIFDDVEEDYTCNECKYAYCYCTKGLNAYRALNTVDRAVAEHTSEDSTDETAYTVNRNSTYWIVDLELLVDEAN